MDQENLVLKEGAEFSNTFQDVTRQSNGNVSELNESIDSTSPSTNFIVSSEKSLHSP